MSAQDQGQKYKFYKILAWALLGAVLTFIASTVALTGNHTFNGPFYNIGEVAEIRINPFRVDIQQEKGYQEASGTVVMEQGFFDYTVTVSDFSDAWNYLCVRIDNLSTESLTWDVSYEIVQDDKVTESTEETYELTEGMNSLPLPEEVFNRVTISIYGEDGCSFCVGKIQFMENLPLTNISRGVVAGVLAAVCYLVLSGIILAIYRKSDRKGRIRPYVCIEVLQEWYLAVIHRIEALQSKLSVHSKRRRVIRTILFLGLFCSDMIVYMSEVYASAFNYYILICILILLAISVLSVEGQTKKKNWNNPLVWGWLIMGAMMCVSDFIVQKLEGNFRFFGFALILFVGFFIFVWNNMKDRGEIIEDFARALHIFFGIVVVYCVLFRPHDGIERYIGFTRNPNTFGIYLVAFWAIMLGSLEHAFRTKKKRGILLLYIIEGCLIFSLVWKTQSATTLLCMGVTAVIWLVRMIVYTARDKRKKVLMGTLICAIVLFLPIHAALSFGLNQVPERLGTAIAYEDDAHIEKVEIGTVAYADERDSEIQNNRLVKKLTSTTLAQALSGRTYIYKEYLRDLNLFGHEDRPDTYGVYLPAWPHNEILGKAYYYGIFTVIPYVIMLLAALIRTWKFGGKKVKYASVPAYVSISFIIMAMAENVEFPFCRLMWTCMYLMMGCVFCEDSLFNADDDSCYKTKDVNCIDTEQK